ncbi:hypothetical protein B0T26DRAFT_670608 [Lasiosphaeria miniovina]|uniref:Steroid 5-alpha reductase C-terminal domain-containing protein n=1 Tax=Lasiosphaeria miniovina TaxID=1954250 RepID=A0AA40BHE6_9PEZI|nr:uncharacterized protein B0T26DRAFT_670608 [Lasiosphaeria miniovina]KAK0734289.1 hypothetical protein B0T26DRAFT_670608 [Lasiosphaeria miniovina]
MAGITIHALDDYYLAITLLTTVGYQLVFFSIAYTFKFDKVTDIAGGTNFIILAIITLAFSGHQDARQLVVSLCMVVWALRLSGYLFFRILKTGKDDRFDEIRERFWAFLGFFVFQMLWVWLVSLPVTVLNSPAVQQYAQHPFGTARDIAGVVLFALGLVVETVSDAHRYRFRSARTDKAAICDTGLFRFSRHPNYFGEIIVHFAIYTIAVSSAADGYVEGPAYGALYATIVGPAFLTFLLMFVSGLTLSERPGAKKRYESGSPREWEAYSRYLRRTSILVPFPPGLYEPLPALLKRTLFLEFPIYVFDPAKHSDKKKQQQQPQTAAEPVTAVVVNEQQQRESADGLVETSQA